MAGTLTVQRVQIGPYKTRWIEPQGLWAICRNGKPRIWFEREDLALMEQVLEALNAEHFKELEALIV